MRSPGWDRPVANGTECLLFVYGCLQGAAEVGGALDQEGRYLELSSSAPWRQALLKKLGLSNDKKSNQQVRD